MSVPVTRKPQLGAAAYLQFVSLEKATPFGYGVLAMCLLSVLLPSAWLAAPMILGTSVVLTQARYRRSAYRFVGGPTPAAQESAEMWSLVSGATVMVAGPVMGVLLLCQMVSMVMPG